MGVLLVAAQRRVGRHRPAVREVACACPARRCRRSARSFSAIGSGRKLYGPIALTKPSGPPSWLAPLSDSTRTSVSSRMPAVVEERDQPRQMLVGVVEHAGEGRLQPREDAPVRRRCARPMPSRRHCARGSRVSGGTIPIAFCRAMPLLALDVPAMGEHRVVALDDVARRLVRRVAGAERDPGQPRHIGPVGDVIGDEADRLVDQVGRQVIAVRVGAGRIDVGVVATPAPARTGRSRRRGSRRSGRSRGRAASRRTARWRRFRSAA